MTWVFKGEMAHRCEPPMVPAFIDVSTIDKCAVSSWDDIWKCDHPGCDRYWVPKAGFSGIFISYWVELKGFKLWRRLRKLKKQEGEKLCLHCMVRFPAHLDQCPRHDS